MHCRYIMSVADPPVIAWVLARVQTRRRAILPSRNSACIRNICEGEGHNKPVLCRAGRVCSSLFLQRRGIIQLRRRRAPARRATRPHWRYPGSGCPGRRVSAFHSPCHWPMRPRSAGFSPCRPAVRWPKLRKRPIDCKMTCCWAPSWPTAICATRRAQMNSRRGSPGSAISPRRP